MNRTEFLPAAVVAIGLVLAGWFVGHGFAEGRASDRFVTVKGVSERDVQADIALWPLRFVATDDQLSRAQTRIKASEKEILAFLDRHGIGTANAEVQQLEVTDRLANLYNSGQTASRYIVAETIMVRVDNPALVEEASQSVGELVDAGVVLSTEGVYSTGPTYLFTKLNDLKPEMIAEATAEARRAGERFAADSDTRLGEIRRANQGLFEILPRDSVPGIREDQQVSKKVRVVSTIDFYLGG